MPLVTMLQSKYGMLNGVRPWVRPLCGIEKSTYGQYLLRVANVSWFSVKWKDGALPLASRSNDGFG